MENKIMPSLGKKYSKWLIGKTIKKVVVGNIGNLSLVFTDGSCIDFQSHCNHACECKESIIVNKFKGDRRGEDA